MCPCFNVKDELEQLLADDPEPVVEEPVEEEKEEPIQEPSKPIIQEHSETIGEASVDWEEKQQGTRPNPIDFIIKLITLIFKAIFSKR